MKAYISGLEVYFPDRKVSAVDLKEALKAVAKVEDGGGFYYLPRQNKPNGITGDGLWEFDLDECNDFILVALKSNSGEYKGLNLYGQEEKIVRN